MLLLVLLAVLWGGSEAKKIFGLGINVIFHRFALIKLAMIRHLF